MQAKETIILMPIKLFNQIDWEFAREIIPECNTLFIFEKADCAKSINSRYSNLNINSIQAPDAIQIMAEMYGVNKVQCMLADGSLVSVNNLKKYFQNEYNIYTTSLNKLKSDLHVTSYKKDDPDSPLARLLKESLKVRGELSVSEELAKTHKVEYIQACMKMTSAYNIYDQILDSRNKDDKDQEEIRDAIKEVRKEENKIRTELDLLSNTLEQYFPKGDFEIKRVRYNDIPMKIDDFSKKLSSHTFPEFLEQVDIRETLDDTYVIEGEQAIIKREKGGKITVEMK